jgi:DUF1680 family protein
LSQIAFGQDSLAWYSLSDRIELATQRLLSDSLQPVFTQDFILADVDTSRFGTRRFTNYSGDLSGRYLEVMSVQSRSLMDSLELGKLVRRIVNYQQADGRFGDPDLAYVSDSVGGEHMAQLWGNGRLLVGLMTYHQRTGDSLSLQSARRLADFFIDSAMVAGQPEIVSRLAGQGAQGIICYTQFIEGLVMVYQSTRARRYLEAASAVYPSLPNRGQQHTHGYLTTLRGMLNLYRETDDPDLLATVREAVDELMLSDDFTRYGTVMEYFGGRGDRDEGCSSADMVRLLFDLHRITRDERYLEAAQFAYYNGLLPNQYASGDFGNHHFAQGAITNPKIHRAWWCCTMHGLRALIDVEKNYAIRRMGSAVTVNLLNPGRFKTPDVEFDLVREGWGRQGERYTVRILDWWDPKFWVLDAHRRVIVHQGGQEMDQPFLPGPGEPISITAAYPLRFHSPEGEVRPFPAGNQSAAGYLTYGPYIMGIRDPDFLAEPDWENIIDPRTLTPGPEPYTLRATYRHGGYAGLHTVTLVPIASQIEAGHPRIRVVTNFGELDLENSEQ